MQSNFGQFQIANPRDCEDSFKQQILPKRTKDISDCKEKIINLYIAVTFTRDITKTTKMWDGLIWTLHTLVTS